MRAAGCGRIIIITSTGGRITLPGVSAYCVSKFALEGFAESLVQEIMPFGVRLVLVEPGIIATELLGRNRNIAPGALNHQSMYYQWFKQLQKETDEELKTATTSPVDVAKEVHRALTAGRPKLRYVVGRRAKVLMALRRRLPGELFDRIWIAVIKRRIPASLYG
jgi:short-subunit dehydrogenase